MQARGPNPVGARTQWGPEGWGPEGWGARRVGARRGGPKFRAFFFPLPIHGDEQCQLRTTYGLRGVRVGEASHPGPNTKRRRIDQLRALRQMMLLFVVDLEYLSLNFVFLSAESRPNKVPSVP